MSGSVQDDQPEWGEQISDAQTRIFLKLAFDIWEILEQHNQLSLNSDPPAADRHSQIRPSGSHSQGGFYDQ